MNIMEQLTHAIDSKNSEWNESYYFAFFDKKNNIGGVSRIGFKPNKPERMTFFILFFPDGKKIAIYNKVEHIKEYSNPFRVGFVEHNCQSDGKWSYLFEGKMIVLENPEDLSNLQESSKFTLLKKLLRKELYKKRIKMNLSFNPISEVYEYSKYMTPESLEIGKKAGDKHWEQIADISGEIQIANDTYKVDNTLGQRDHTYGVRDWTGVGNWLYYVIWFNKNLAINPAAIVMDDGKMSSGGFLFKNGKNIPIKTIKIIEQKFREENVFPISSELEIVDYSGEKHVLKANAGTIVPIPFRDNEGNKSYLIQSFGNFKLNEISGGYGTFETLRKAKKIN